MLSEIGSAASGLERLIPPDAAQTHDRPVVEVVGVSKRYRRYARRNLTLKGRVMDWLRGQGDQYVDFDALKDVSLIVSRGETLGILGRNGAGKSTLLRIIAKVAEPDAGVVHVNGRVSPLLELGAGFSPELTGRRNIFLYGALLGLSRSEISMHLEEIIAFSEIGDFLDTPVKHYSSGMYLRLAFAVAAHLNPDILLLDEVLAVGDAGFQAKCLARINEFRRQGMTILVVTHDTGRVLELCDRALLLNRGAVCEDGPPQAVVGAYARLLTS